MTKTNYMLIASALALTANHAGAFDFYGNFSNQETVVHADSRDAAPPSAVAYSPGRRTSLDTLTAGSPDSTGHSIPGYVKVTDPRAPAVTSLDSLTAGSPDSSFYGQALSRPSSATAASRPRPVPDGV
jgi:hypothetical protein